MPSPAARMRAEVSSGTALSLVDGDRKVDRDRVERAIAELLVGLGRDSSDLHLADTPRRVADAFIELLSPQDFFPTTFPNDERYTELVLVRDIPFHSLCEHHLLPFRGIAHIGYLPGDRLIGLSKLARVLQFFARDLQVQERLTRQVANWLDDRLQAEGVGVVIEAEHLCMSLRGVTAAGSKTMTSVFLGSLEKDSAGREKFLGMAGIRG